MLDFVKEKILEKGINFIIDLFKKNQIKKRDEFIKNFYSVINSDEYKEFEFKLLQKYYVNAGLRNPHFLLYLS